MNIFGRLLITMLFVAITSFPILTAAQENHKMRYSESLYVIQDIIQKTAKQQGIKIDEIKWSHTKDENIIATVNYEGIQKQVIFSKIELEKINKDNIPTETLRKIHETISQLPGRTWPPGIKQ